MAKTHAPTLTRTQLERARRLLCHMQETIRDKVLAARKKQGLKLTRIAAVTKADTIYQVDKVSEAAIRVWFEKHWPKTWPVELVMEGLEDGEAATFPEGTPVEKTLFKCIIDPIDGTRNLMYDKRSAWVLTGLAPQRGEANRLGDILVAAMTEIPSSKQLLGDQFSGIRGGSLKGCRENLETGRRQTLRATPSPARDYHHGFSSVVKYFPGGKELTARVEEALWSQLKVSAQGGSPVIFDDQYPSTGGQLYELMVGHDRMVADLRPLVFTKLGMPKELVCHPYDICTCLLLELAGGVVAAPEGAALDIPLDTTSPVAWVGFANSHLARKTQAVLKDLCRQHLST